MCAYDEDTQACCNIYALCTLEDQVTTANVECLSDKVLIKLNGITAFMEIKPVSDDCSARGLYDMGVYVATFKFDGKSTSWAQKPA